MWHKMSDMSLLPAVGMHFLRLGELLWNSLLMQITRQPQKERDLKTGEKCFPVLQMGCTVCSIVETLCPGNFCTHLEQ